MNIFQRYIDQQNDQYYIRLDRQTKRASIFVVIPCYNEPDIFTTLDSLAACYPPKASVSVFVVVNDSDDAPEEAIAQNILTLNSIKHWNIDHPHSFFDVQRIYAHALPRKWAGVGWARKLGMDEAIKQIVSNNLPDGIIVSFDADSTVSPNYLQSIELAFEDNPTFNFFTIHFEHPYTDQRLSPSIREGIIRYELHMRYFRSAMQWSGYPHAIHTVGSSFVLKASAYVRQGGMNRRKAGEDFYFLHKLVLLGHYGNINTTTVFPSARQSDRVPFGTGAAIKKWSEGSSELNYTYSLEPFRNLKSLFAHPSYFLYMKTDEISDFLSNLHPSLQLYLKKSRTIEELLELKDNCSNEKVFEKRFFHLLNAFWILKYLNFAHETSYNRTDLRSESIMLLQFIGIQVENYISIENLLEIFRNSDKKVDNCI
jgi:glycosyltransferase involved in cell wall biosynthesis